MAQRLTDSDAKALPPPATGAKITYDSEVAGFGLRVTARGARSFVLNYRTRSGRERRFTIGSFPDWKVGAARDEARNLKKAIDRGEDPMADLQAGREAPTVADLCQRYLDDELPKRRALTARDYRRLIELDIKPELGAMKVAEVTFADVDKLHRKITRRGAAYVANRAVALLSRLFSLAIKWQWRADNPAKGIERNQEQKRHRYLNGRELAALSEALAGHRDRQAADIVRLLLLTGARRGEVMSARWDQFDLESGVWTKPGATTKQKTEHRAPLSAPARLLLAEIHADAQAAAEKDGDVPPFVFPGRGVEHRTEIKRSWAELCKAAKLSNVRIHDLRHTFASILASSGLSLPVIGALLGHTQVATTARYAHLLDDPLRQAAERAGAIVTGRPSGAVVPLKERS